MADVAQLGIRVDSSGAIKAVSDLDRLTASAGKADAATEQLATSTGQVSKAMSPAAQQSRMVAMQLSQVAQQASATGNFVQALAIQLPDMAMGFGTIGIAAGVLASVALPAVINAMASGSASAYGFRQALADLTTAAQAAQDKLASIRIGISDDQALAAARELGALIAEQARYREEAVAAEGAEALALINQADALSAQITQLRAKLRTYQEVEKQIEAAKVEQDLMADGMSRAALEAAKLAGVDLSNIDAAAKAAAEMADRFGIAFERAQAMVSALEYGKLQNQFGGGPDAARSQVMNLNAPGLPKLASGAGGVAPATRGASGGVGGGVDPMQTRIETLQKTLSTERDLEIAHYAQQQADLQAALQSRLLTQQEYNGYIQQAEAMHAAKMVEIKQSEAAMVREASQNMYGALAGFLDMFAGKSKAAAIASIAINKALSIAQIIQNSGVAATRALAELGPIAGPPAAAKILAFGKLQAALVAATGFAQAASAGGGGSIGSLGKKAAAQGLQADAPQSVEYIVRGIDRTRTYSGEELAMIFDGISEEAAKRGMATFRFI